MRAYDIIEKKKNGAELTQEEIEFLVNGYLQEDIKDYQMSAFLMAVCLKGMTNQECSFLTNAMLNSGERIDLSSIEGIKVDKHSTGGVGDKTTIILAPLVACFGVKVAKMSGRALGHTGGTVDKLESIDGINLAIEKEKFFKIVNEVGCCVISQTSNLVPADKKIYALRDVTATVESIPLIASSIMSKKLASGSDCILLDVKVGDGAFMKNTKDAIDLSRLMVDIGTKFKKKVVSIITDMKQPLGNAIGNFLEVWEACEVLKGRGPQDLRNISIYLAAHMLSLAEKGSFEECEKMAKEAIADGKALEKLQEMISALGGDASLLQGDNYPNKSKIVYEYLSDFEGYISEMQADKLGKAAMVLGAGRQSKEEYIDPYAGIILNKKIGDQIKKGELLATLYSSSVNRCKEGESILKDSIKILNVKPKTQPLIKAKITNQGVEKYSLL